MNNDQYDEIIFALKAQNEAGCITDEKYRELTYALAYAYAVLLRVNQL